VDCFYIDESGYTGFDLLNQEQRFQRATAVALSMTKLQNGTGGRGLYRVEHDQSKNLLT
jgi:hypothetical protein